MEYQIFLVLAPFSIGILLGTGSLIYHKKQNFPARILLIYFIFVSCYLFSNIAELLLSSESWTLTAAKLQHFFFSFIPPIWFYFVLVYVKDYKLRQNKFIIILCLIPVLTNIFTLTNSIHHLIWKDIVFFRIDNRYLTMKAVYGPWMWIYGGYNNLLYFLGALKIVQSSSGGMKLYQKQSVFIIIGILFPVFFNFVYVLHLFPYLRKDYTSISFAITAICNYIAITKLQLFQVAPVTGKWILQNLKTALVVLNTDYQVIDFNQAGKDLLKLSDDNLGMNFKDIGSLDFFIKGINNYNDAWNSQGQVEFNSRFYRIQWKPITVDQTFHEGFLITIVDITQEIIHLREKTDLAAHLEKVNKELQSAHSIILQQEKLAVIGQVTAGIAHEMNNPLSFVRSNFYTFNHYWKLYRNIISVDPETNTIIERPDLEKIENQMAAMLKDLQEGTERVISIVQNLLKFSRSERSKEEKLFDLNKEIETSLIMMGNQLKYTAEVVKDYGDIPKAECRENDINQVVVNLISNAVHAMKLRKDIDQEGYTPLLSIRTWADNNYIFCEIGNNGLQIPEKDILFLFDPFFTTKKAGEGTGLGLAIAKDIIEGRYEGSLRVETTDRTLFTFSLPIVNRKRINKSVSDNFHTRGT